MRLQRKIFRKIILLKIIILNSYKLRFPFVFMPDGGMRNPNIRIFFTLAVRC